MKEEIEMLQEMRESFEDFKTRYNKRLDGFEGLPAEFAELKDNFTDLECSVHRPNLGGGSSGFHAGLRKKNWNLSGRWCVVKVALKTPCPLVPTPVAGTAFYLSLKAVSVKFYAMFRV